MKPKPPAVAPNSREDILTRAPSFAHSVAVKTIVPWLLALILPLVIACSSGQSKRSGTNSLQSSWSGTWTRIDGLAIPRETQLLLPQSCTKSPEYWTIEQKESTVKLEFHEATQQSGIELSVERHKHEYAEGQRRRSFARLEGVMDSMEVVHHVLRDQSPKFPVTYELEYDPKTEHLTGTRNGAPLRFVRAELQPVDFGDCQPVP